MDSTTRRRMLKLSGVALASTAGCVGGGGGGGGDFEPMDLTANEFQNPSEVDYESQFNLWDWYTGTAAWATEQLPNAFENLNTVNNSGYSSASEWYGRLESGNHQMDIVGGKTEFTRNAIDNDYLAPLPVSEMPNWEHVTDDAKDFFNEYLSDDEGNIYAVPQTQGMGPTIGYNSDVFDEPPTSWDVLWDDEYEGRITMPNTALEVGMVGALYTGQDPFDPDDFDDIREALVQQKPLNSTYWEEFSGAERMFTNKSVDLGACTRGLLYDARFSNDAPHIEYTVPEEGAFVFSNHYIVPSDAPHPKISTLYANWMMEPSRIVHFFTEDGYSVPIKNLDEALQNAGVSEEQAAWFAPPSDANIRTIPPLDDSVIEEYDNVFSEVQAA
jgi:spermidine/putrescine transport system substrate-binding protein